MIVCGFDSPAGDMVFRLPPVRDVDAAEMIAALRPNRPVYGGSDGWLANPEALTVLLMRISALVEIVPEMSELELHSAILQSSSAGIIVVDARMHLELSGRTASSPND